MSSRNELETANRKYRNIVEEKLANIDYRKYDTNYVPSDFALEFILFMKMVTGKGEEFPTPPFHYVMLDTVSRSNDILNLSYRGSAKTTLLIENMILYIAAYNRLPGLRKKIKYGIFIGDTIDNGVKNARENIEYRWQNSEFLQSVIPEINMTKTEWRFKNAKGEEMTVMGYGVITGVRGTKRYGIRPQFALIDDIISDEVAESPSMIQKVGNIISRAVEHALDKNDRKIIWSGTPFSESDPLYSAATSGAWDVNVFPGCNKFDDSTTPKDYVSSWPEAFPYATMKRLYEKAKRDNDLQGFYQEIMLQVVSDEMRLIKDEDLKIVPIQDPRRYQCVITTDWAVSQKKGADLSAICVWALTPNQAILIDGYAGKELMNVLLEYVIDFVKRYGVETVTMEATGQQEGFIHIVNDMMIKRGITFNVLPIKYSTSFGKLNRIIREAVPNIKNGKVAIAEHMMQTDLGKEAVAEILSVTNGGVKSRHDDVLDCIVALGHINNSPSSIAHEELVQASMAGIYQANESNPTYSAPIGRSDPFGITQAREPERWIQESNSLGSLYIDD